jgi:RNA polymerase sigma-70 factor (ECF subfamily)
MVRQAMDQLSEDHRSILVLREMQGMSYEHIAEMLDISIGTVRSRLSRARTALREELERLPGWE